MDANRSKKHGVLYSQTSLYQAVYSEWSEVTAEKLIIAQC